MRVKNNGSAPWPKEVFLAPVDADAIPAKGRESAFFCEGNWLSPSRVVASVWQVKFGALAAADPNSGGIEDFRNTPFRLKESGWHKFAIRCAGSTLTYELDDQPFHEARHGALKSGDCGIYYRAAFYDVENGCGIAFAGFKVEE